jgi:ABC-type multidrug transport system fused ATPase/permease subunit
MNAGSEKEEKAICYLLSIGKVITGIIYWGTVMGNLYYAGYLVSQPNTGYEVGDLITIFGCQVMANFAIVSLQISMRMEKNAISSGTRILHISKYHPNICFEGGDRIENFRGEIEFRNVSFKYPSRDTYVLKNVSFRIRPGQIVALIGHSGSGKSTCVQLIERFYDTTDGMILLDGHDIKTLDPRWIHQKIGLVAQDPVLFHTTVRTNIVYGTWQATDEQIAAAAEAANIASFINTLPHKYDEMVGEKGSTLSGGQRQRIAIARAIVKDPVILVTDEATSALDAESERRVQDALDHVMQNRTAVIVAHRLSTIRNAHVIHVFDDGSIKESGTHDELVARKSYYYNLVSRQLESAPPNPK